MNVAIVSSAHGYGHATRDVVLADTLAARGHRCTLFSAAPVHVLGRAHAVVAWRPDVGLVQADSLREDLPGTLAQLPACEVGIAALADRLGSFHRVVVDVSPFALEAARRAGVPAVAMGNFDWAWTYRHYPLLAGWAERLAAWQAPHPGVELWPGPGLHHFATTRPGGMLARAGPPVRVAQQGVLVCFGGLGLHALDALLPVVPGVTWVLAPPMPRLSRPDAIFVDDVPFPSLVAGAGALFTKPGYGILGEALRAGTPMVYLDRGAFPEAPYLERVMAGRGDVRVPRVDAGPVAEAIREVLRRARPPARGADDREAVADAVLSG